jgi:hydrogenase maturation protease
MDALRDILVIGIGNRFRGDDGIGPAVIDSLRADPPHATLCEASGEATELIETWSSAELVLIVDCISSGAAPGTIHHIEANSQTLPPQILQTSTHSFGLAEAVELGRTLGRLPPLLIVYGIEGRDFGYGHTLSEPVASVVATVADRIRDCIRRRSGHIATVGEQQ